MSDTDRVAPGADAGTALLDELRRMARGTLVERLGIELLEAGPERVVGTMPVAGNTQPLGLLHGGASVAFAETLGSYAAALHAGPGRQAVGIEVSATHHRGVRDGVVTGRATAVHLGGTTASYEIVVEDETSRRICTARLTCLLIAARGDSQSPDTSERPAEAATPSGADAAPAADPAAASLD
jgi:1,4-dihydroxy-2-naphthoyl-CoA hydrolase